MAWSSSVLGAGTTTVPVCSDDPGFRVGLLRCNMPGMYRNAGGNRKCFFAAHHDFAGAPARRAQRGIAAYRNTTL
jgi:hypothetical protein